MKLLLPALALSCVAAAPAAAEIAMFSQRNFQGARYSLEAESANMNFSPRSVRVLEGQAWQICPRPFFGGDCRTIHESNPKLNLPRAFSGMVRSARPLPMAATAKPAPPVHVAPPKPAPEVKPKPDEPSKHHEAAKPDEAKPADSKPKA
ncbi:beta/gamma crystallin-related protein [Sandaracinobacter neustonicus]|nr:beta/gamma crystallin-related protein [Sandaracinobacter neustonicus]